MVSPLNLHIEAPLRCGGFISLDYAGPINPGLGDVVDGILALVDEGPADRPQPTADGGADDDGPVDEVPAGALDGERPPAPSTSAPPSPPSAGQMEAAVLAALVELDGAIHVASGSAQRDLLAMADVDLAPAEARQLIAELDAAGFITRDRRGPKTYSITITDAGRRQLELEAA